MGPTKAVVQDGRIRIRDDEPILEPAVSDGYLGP